jgi:DinB superfamily
VSRDWHEWHRAYDTEASPLAQRLVIVRQCIADALTAAPPGPIRVISMCAGEGRDLLGVLERHPRAADVRGRLVELDPELAATAREHAPASIEVLCADAGSTSAYEGAVPADLVLVCGVFGNITNDDIAGAISTLPSLCAPGATVIWTRHRRPPDVSVSVRDWFAAAGFGLVEFAGRDGFLFGVGVHRLASAPAPFVSGVRLFDFVALDTTVESCEECGFIYAVGRAEILAWLTSDADAFVDRFAEYAEADARTRPAPDVWSPLEYACHVRDVVRIQTRRVEQTQREVEPAFTPMRRDERVVEDRYNEQDPKTVAAEIIDATGTFVALLARLDDTGWSRTGIYNYPAPAPRTVEWIATHTSHELLHHRRDITRPDASIGV